MRIESNKTIEDFPEMYMVDFANSYIGGGALSSGCLQEEIIFMTYPELYISILFCESMNDNEVI